MFHRLNLNLFLNLTSGPVFGEYYKSPVHTYAANGTYTIKLTAANNIGSDEKSSEVEIVNITIDGNFTDWDKVRPAATYTEGEAGSILEAKFENLKKNKLFVLLKATEVTFGYIKLLINIDGDPATGFSSGLYPATPGFDLLLEGYVVDTGVAEPFFGYYDDVAAQGDKTAWVWRGLESSFLKRSSIGFVNGIKMVEFSIDLAEFDQSYTVSDTLRLFIVDIDARDGANPDLAAIGNFPVPVAEATSAAYLYDLSLHQHEHNCQCQGH